VAPDSLLLPPKIKTFGPQKQTGIHQFFRVLTEDEIQAVQAKRKRVDSEEKDADQVGKRKGEEDQRQGKLVSRGNKDYIAQKNTETNLSRLTLRLVCEMPMGS